MRSGLVWGVCIADKDEGRRWAFTLQAAQRSQLVALEGMRAGGAVLDPAHVEHCPIEVDLVPAQVADFGRPEPVAEGDQDHGRVPVAISIGLGGLDQRFDLAWRQVLTGARLHIRSPCRRNCSENFSWCDQLE